MKKGLFVFATLTLLLGVFNASALAQKATPNDRFAFLQQIYFENSTHRYDAYLLTELEAFLRTQPSFGQNDQILFMFADVLEQQKHYKRALINLLKIPVLFPKSTVRSDALQKIKQVLKKIKSGSLLEQNETLLSYARQPHYFDSNDEALLDLYNFLFSLNIPCLRRALLNELNFYETRCSAGQSQEDLVLYLKGSLLQQLGEFAAAEANFRELGSLYKKSPLLPRAYYRTALLDYKHLHKFTDAQNTFLRVINSFPTDTLAANAQFFLAELYADSLDSLSAGIDNYRLFLDAFPNHPWAGRAFKRLTFLLFKTKRHEEAITLIASNLNAHADDSTFYALVDSMAKVFRKDFKQYKYAARCYVLLASVKPQSHKAPFYLYTAAKLYLQKVKDRKRAKEICLRLQKAYKKSPYAVKCRRLLKK